MEQSVGLDNQQERLESDLHWLGAIFDGEGCVTAGAGHTKTGHGYPYKHRRYIPNISIVNTDRGIISEVLRILTEIGIPFHAYSRGSTKNPHWKIKTEIMILGMKRCKKACSILRPYLRSIKKERIELLEEWIDYRLGQGQKKEYTEDDYTYLGLIRENSRILRDYTSSPTTVGEDIVQATAKAAG